MNSEMVADGGERPDGKTKDEFVQNTSTFRLIFLGLILVTPILSPGSIGAFNSIAQPQMKLSVEYVSWFGSIISITCPMGSLCIGSIIDKFGRKISMLCGIVPSMIGWLLLADRNAALAQLFIGRALTGFAIGAAVLPSVIYAAECITVNHPRIRSSMGTLVTLSMAFGGLLVYCLGIFLPYHNVALFCGILSVASLLLIVFFIPESPAWLFRKGRVSDAETAERRLGIKQPILHNRKVIPTAATEIGAEPSQPNERSSGSNIDDFKRYLRQIERPEVYKPLIITISAEFFCQFSGLYCVSGYTVELITVHPWETSAYIFSFVAQVLQIIGCLLFMFVLPFSGLRAMSIASFLCISLGHIVLAFSLLFGSSSTPNIFNYLHVLSVWEIMLVDMGVLGITGAILGEFFPMGAKGLASIPHFLASVFMFIVMKMYPVMFAQHGSMVFFIFGVVSACGTVFVAIFLPETVGRTMDEISSGFQKSHKMKSSSTLDTTYS